MEIIKNTIIRYIVIGSFSYQAWTRHYIPEIGTTVTFAHSPNDYTLMEKTFKYNEQVLTLIFQKN